MRRIREGEARKAKCSKICGETTTKKKKQRKAL